MTIRFGSRNKVDIYTTSWQNKPTSIPIEYVIVAGGGAGGCDSTSSGGGGGGAGG